MMIDCGEGCQLQLRRFGVRFNRLTDIFISHMHGDHCLGLPGLLSSLSLQDKQNHLTVHLPADGIEIMQRMIDYFCGRCNYDIELKPLPSDSGVLLDTKSFRVETFRLLHGVPSHGFKFSLKPHPRTLLGDMVDFHNVPAYARAAIKEGADWVRPDGTVISNEILTKPGPAAVSYSYCSDTMYCPQVIPHIKGSTLLYHEATYATDNAAKAKERFHSTAAQAAMIARDAAVGRLLIGHYSQRYKDITPLLNEARQIFSDTTAAYEGLTIEL